MNTGRKWGRAQAVGDWAGEQRVQKREEAEIVQYIHYNKQCKR